MRTVAVLVVLGSLIALGSSPTVAQSFTVKGAVECADFVLEHENNNYRAMNQWWVLGYITGRNMATGTHSGKGVGADAIYAFALSYCRNNPYGDNEDAARAAYDVFNFQ